MLIAAACLEAAKHLNDPGQAMYTTAVLTPCFDAAYRELYDAFVENGTAKSRRKISPVWTLAPAFNYFMNWSTVPLSVPADFIYPIKLFDRASGSTDSWVECQKLDWEVLDTLNNPLEKVSWSWHDDTIWIGYVKTSRDVYCEYEGAGLYLPSAGIVEERHSDYLIYKAAALAAMEIGENPTRAADLEMKAKGHFDSLINQAVRSRQSLPARRRPYRRDRRRY